MPERKKKILIVDDEPEFAKLIKTRLTAEGYLVDTAEDGQQGLDKVKACPDLVILDVMMPIINGYNFCRLLKSQESVREIPIIFLTSRDKQEDREIGIEMGADVYLTKPVQIDDLLTNVKQQLVKEQSQND